MTTKSNFRNLKLKSHEEYLIYRTYFIKQKTRICKLNRKVRKGERNDKMTRKSKSKAKSRFRYASHPFFISDAISQNKLFCQRSDAFQPHALFSAEALKAKKHLYSLVCISIKEQKKKEKASHNTPTAKSALKKKSVQYNSDPLFLSLGQGENLCQPSPLRPTSVQITCSRIRSCFHIGLQGG